MNLWTKLLLAAVLVLAGCSSAGRVRQVSPGLYAISVTGDGYVSAPKLREESLDRAGQFCAHQGKRMTLAREDSDGARYGTGTTLRVTFRCIDG